MEIVWELLTEGYFFLKNAYTWSNSYITYLSIYVSKAHFHDRDTDFFPVAPGSDSDFLSTALCERDQR